MRQNARAHDPSRRRFIALAGLACTGIAPSARALVPTSRQLSFQHTHTAETLSATYWQAGRYDARALQLINRLLRDFRTNEIHPIAEPLLDQLYDLQQLVGNDAPFEVISGYRSPSTNDMLQRTTSGVATWSLHMSGCAIDVRLPGTSLRRLRDAAASLRRGGIGYYPSSDFIHLDTGRFRQW